VAGKYVNNRATKSRHSGTEQTKPILTDTKMAAIDLHIFAAENIDLLMHDVYVLYRSQQQERKKRQE
jgi:hypothetical protein